MYADGTLERFDEIAITAPAYPETVDPQTRQVLPQQRAGIATLDDFYLYVADSLASFQSFYIEQNFGDEWRGSMPHAFLLQRGLKLVNIDTQAEYTISEVVTNKWGVPTGEVRLSGVSGNEPAPTVSDRLELRPEDRIRFARVSKRSDDIDFEEDATRKDTPKPWAPYIDFAVLEETEAACPK